jgi:hypothetical protein
MAVVSKSLNFLRVKFLWAKFLDKRMDCDRF